MHILIHSMDEIVCKLLEKELRFCLAGFLQRLQKPFGEIVCKLLENELRSCLAGLLQRLQKPFGALMKSLKMCSYRDLRWEKAKNSGLSRLHLILHGIVWEYILRNSICGAILPSIYQNDSSSTDRIIQGAKSPKNGFIGEVKLIPNGA